MCILYNNYRIYLEVYYESPLYEKDINLVQKSDKFALKSQYYEIKPGNILALRYLKKYRFEPIVPFDITYKMRRLEVSINNVRMEIILFKQL